MLPVGGTRVDLKVVKRIGGFGNYFIGGDRILNRFGENLTEKLGA